MSLNEGRATGGSGWGLQSHLEITLLVLEHRQVILLQQVDQSTDLLKVGASSFNIRLSG
jgi:hypothetical protein